MKYGLQLFSMRDQSEKDFALTIKKAADIGYDGVEFAGFYGKSADETVKLLADNRLTIFGTHSAFDDLLNNFEETVEYHKAIGNKNYIIPGYSIETKEQLRFFVDAVNKIQPLIEAEGIKLGYHNHSHEFLPNKDGIIAYDVITGQTNVSLEIDTYWAFNAGLDPIELMNRYKDRLLSIHLKDGFKGGKGAPLGKGEAPVKAVHDEARALNIPIIVESETLTPSGEEESRICFEYLKTL